MELKAIITKHWLTAVGVIVGAIGGYLYWLFIGCESGTCPITSSPTVSSLWGAVLGGSIFSMFKIKSNKSDIK